ncbi:hypothetical protein PFICI_11868 [Pestalotiopsis fici W106-1]|uniref:Cupin type-2 domain-containing protein n=1 Tax=Pestalotiopsis fici (strain W106-1 / CGMCC3.15140) TaxID=1229662 RepID=W3WUE1_PESFW|nr:uncharacterized protein PFICI_11868 [Pestalotiopsis fici W106-1]ETS76481.1 hypothetical protein PFICI_11868 [Pestalotiopsis fici W106-1]
MTRIERLKAVLPHELQDDGTLNITAFEGAIVTRVLQAEKQRAFHFEVIFYPNHPRLRNAPSKPPAHFHPYQEEYVSVTEGALTVEVEGVEHIVRPGDPEFVLRRGVNHRLYPTTTSDTAQNQTERVRCNLSAEGTPNAFALDLVFFENWYAYQEQIVVHGARLDLIQVMSMFDGGDSYLSLPWWVPFRSLVARTLGIVVGRWLGGLLGYQPFYEEWTTDWDLACAKMETSMFQTRFSDKRKTV